MPDQKSMQNEHYRKLDSWHRYIDSMPRGEPVEFRALARSWGMCTSMCSRIVRLALAGGYVRALGQGNSYARTSTPIRPLDRDGVLDFLRNIEYASTNDVRRVALLSTAGEAIVILKELADAGLIRKNREGRWVANEVSAVR